MVFVFSQLKQESTELWNTEPGTVMCFKILSHFKLSDDSIAEFFIIIKMQAIKIKKKTSYLQVISKNGKMLTIYIYLFYCTYYCIPGGWRFHVQETWVWALGGEDPLEKEMVIHSSILAWRIPMDRERSLAGYSPWGCKEWDMNEHTHPLPPKHIYLSIIYPSSIIICHLSFIYYLSCIIYIIYPYTYLSSIYLSFIHA